MELDILHSHIASPYIVANFAALVQRTADKEIPHGVDVLVGIYARLLKERQPLTLNSGFPISLPSFSKPPKPAELAVGVSNASDARVKHETGPFHVDKRGGQSESLPWESSVAPLSVTPQTSASMAATSIKEPDMGGKGNKKATRKRK
jgi:hypothetical protein